MNSQGREHNATLCSQPEKKTGEKKVCRVKKEKIIRMAYENIMNIFGRKK